MTVPVPPPRLDQSALLHLIGYNLRRASVLFMTDFNGLLKRWRLSPTEFTILLVIEHRSDVTQAILCRTLGVKGANMTPMINRLEKHGFIKRNAHPTDRRQPNIHMTPSAAGLMPRWKGALQEEEHRLH